MKLKNTNKNTFQPVIEQHYKKSYLLRQIIEEEAEQDIKDYSGDTEDYPEPEALNRPT
jgi:hypothetical protein